MSLIRSVALAASFQLFLVVLISGFSPAFAEPLASYSKTALSVRNTDPEVKDTERWKNAAKDIYSWLKRNPNSAETNRALLLGATLDRSLALKTQDLDYAIRGIKGLQKIEKATSKGSELGQALLQKGEFFALLGAYEEAELNYKKLLSSNADSSLKEIAKRKVKDPKQVDASEDDYIKRMTRYFDDDAEKVVVLDPGHGGEDFGAVGIGGIEKNYVLDIARRVRRKLEDKNIAVLLTRDEDRFVPLATRAKLANTVKADLFVSLHANASPSKKLSGIETYYLDNTDDEGSRLLAERENGMPSGGDLDDLSFMLSDLVQSGKLDDSVKAAHHIEKGILSVQKVKSLGVKKAPFYVLVGAHMPCVLLEMLFVDNNNDAELIKNDKFREKLAEGISKGITKGL